MDSLDIVGIRLTKENTIMAEKKIKTPRDAIEVLANELRCLDREMMMSINLNNKNQIINAHVVSIGTLNKSLVDPKSIFKASLLSNASSIMLIHNHPSGNVEPSKEDIFITNIIEKNCQMMDMKLLDHIIIGEDEYYSMKCETIEKIDKMNKDEFML